MTEIKDGHLFCCGDDLGVFNKKEAYYCPTCQSLLFQNTNKQQKIEKWLGKEE